MFRKLAVASSLLPMLFLFAMLGADAATGRPGKRDVAILKLLAAAPTCQGADFDPLAPVAVVNALHPLGKKRSLAMLRDFRKRERAAHRSGEQIFLVLRALFEPPETATVFPVMMIGAPDWTPSTPEWLPRFPLVLSEDLPLFLVNGYALGSKPEDALVHIDWCAKHCRLRAKPLRPPDDPMAAADVVTGRIHELRGPENTWRRGLIRNQVVRALRHAWGPPDPHESRLYPGTDHDAETYWRELRDRLRIVKIVWSPEAGEYIRVSR